MADPSKMSDAELLAHYAMPALTAQESGGHGDAVSPKGARGSTQMLEDTARATAARTGMPWRPELMTGTSDEALNYQQTLGRAYLQEGIEKTGSLDGGLRYYHGGPDRQQWGPKTDHYATAVQSRLGMAPAPKAAAEMSDDELLAAYQGKAEEPVIEGEHRVVSDKPASAAAPPRKTPIPMKGGKVSQVADAAFGLGGGATKGAASMTDTLASFGPLGLLNSEMGGIGTIMDLLHGKGPTAVRSGLVDVASKTAARSGYKPQTDLGRFTEALGTFLPNALIPASGASRVASVVAPAVGQEVAKHGAAALGLGDTGQAIAGVVGAGLGGLATGIRLPSSVPKLPTADLAALDEAQRAAWRKVDASTYQFPDADASATANAVKKIVNEADPDLYGDSAKWAAKIQRMADRGDLTLGKLNTLKSQMGEQLLTGKEASVGRKMIVEVEGLIDTAKDPALAEARDAYKRFAKLKDITQRVESADLAGVPAGRRIRPLVDPRSPQQMRNATPDEKAALREVAKGSLMSNLLAPFAAMDPTASKLMSALQGAAGVATLGKTVPLAAIGFAANRAKKGIEANSLQDLMDLIAAGGVPMKAPPLAPYAGAAVPTSMLLSGAAVPAAASPPRRQQTSRR